MSDQFQVTAEEIGDGKRVVVTWTPVEVTRVEAELEERGY